MVQVPVDQLEHGLDIVLLEVDDGVRRSRPAVTAVIKNAPPLAAIAGPDLVVVGAGQDVTIDASRSSDPDADMLIYLWTLNGSPLAAKTGDPEVQMPASALDRRINEVMVAVRDGMGGYIPGTDSVSVRINVPPQVEAGPDLVIYNPTDRNVVVALQGAATDQEGDPLACCWRIGDDVVATGLEAEAVLPTGLHTIALDVDHGYTCAMDVVELNVIGPTLAQCMIVSPAEIGRTSTCQDVKFYVPLPQGTAFTDLDLTQHARLFFVDPNGQAVEV